jgi:hypothetical protein
MSDEVTAMDQPIQDNALFNDISLLIERGKNSILAHANRTSVSLFWHIGKRIYDEILENRRADYGKQIVSRLATQLTAVFGRSFEARNLRRMMQFNEQFSDFETEPLSALKFGWLSAVWDARFVTSQNDTALKHV